MKCPRCETDLPGRIRTGRTCWRCQRRFALEPKYTRGLHDLRLRRTVERLGDDGRVVLTVEQLRWAHHERGRPSPLPRKDPPGRPAEPRFEGVGVLAFCLGMGTGLLTVAWLLVTRLPAAIILAAVAGFFGLALLGAMAKDGVRLLRRKRIRADWELAERQWQLRRELLRRQEDAWTAPLTDRPDWTEAEFRSKVLSPWAEVYGGLPDGVVADAAVRPSVSAGTPTLAVLCPDRTVTAFLYANTFAVRYRAVLVATTAELPEDLPVVVLHDASPEGLLLVREARTARPGVPVVDAGLSARTAVAAGDRAVQLYRHRERAALAELLARLPGLSEGERLWLAAGLWSPLVAVPPKRLLTMAERAAERALHGSVGFLSWPVPEVPR
ncbi:hypothetical protein SAMN05216371_7171 [Streptomyces sp. TLI_053]|uniref:hypothetical protein n=1 Tax=Streptomyces sp. TLI_053 TaxID=1855352 RepID=UPI00087A1BA0|nr:hypothetical protein [Streptomyces sp. TLI_053]SDT82386.1 hypothetical protein SAMN05216371_7171 [Streptomyces sp. TLI_053]